MIDIYIALKIICAVLAVAASALTVIRTIHMFQQNSYKPHVQLKWMAANAKHYIINFLILAIAVAAIFVNKVWLYIVFYVLAVICALANMPMKNAKKPLVYTARVKRMLATDAVVLIAAYALSFFAGAEKAGLFGFATALALTPFVVLIGNFINSPIEKAIRQYYINDAKKMLKACPDLKVIGITGSYGKTSVKYFLSTALKAKYNVLMTPESYNTPMGVVKTIREQLRPTHEIFVCEMGARNVGDIKEICDIVFPDYGIITSIGEQHLESFKSIDNIVKTKFELYDAVPNKENMFLNGDNQYISAKLSENPNAGFHTYGIGNKNETYACDIRVTRKGTSFSVVCGDEKIENLQTPLVGEHNVTNLMGVVAVCRQLGVDADDIRMQLKKLASPPHRLQLTRRGNTAIIDDAYNSNPAGCEAALKTLALFDGEKILITPGMVELGKMQDHYNYEFGKSAASVCDHVYLVGKKQTEAIYKGLEDGGMHQSGVTVCESFIDAFNKASSSPEEKIILIENDLPDNY